MLNSRHSLSRRTQGDCSRLWFAAPVITVLAAVLALAMLPEHTGAPGPTPAQIEVPAAEADQA